MKFRARADAIRHDQQMGMLDAVASRVNAGATVEFRPSGSSMVPLIRSRQQVRVAPVGLAKLEVGNIVLACVAGTIYLHLVSAMDPARQRVQISNNKGRVNGWTSHDRVFGICLTVDGAARPGAERKLRASAAAPAASPGRGKSPAPTRSDSTSRHRGTRTSRPTRDTCCAQTKARPCPSRPRKSCGISAQAGSPSSRIRRRPGRYPPPRTDPGSVSSPSTTAAASTARGNQ